MRDKTNKKPQEADIKALKWAAIATAAIIFLCLGGLILYFKDSATFGKNFGAGGLILIAFIVLGTMVGFLFGVPKEKGGSSPQDAKPGVHANTNLEQISDWLTKIIVGVGLTQLNNVPSLLKRAATFFSYSFQDCVSPAGTAPANTLLCQSHQSVVMTIILLGLATGFLAGFLFTRLYLTRAFDENDDALDDDDPGAPQPPDAEQPVKQEAPAQPPSPQRQAGQQSLQEQISAAAARGLNKESAVLDPANKLEPR